MKCDLNDRRKVIAAYLTGELSEAEMNEFEQHYFQCEDCFQELKIGQDAVNLIEKEGPTVLAIPVSWWEKARQTLTDAFPRRRWTFALAALVLLMVIALPLGYLKYFHQTPSAESYAENFKPSSRLDDLIRQTYQSPTLLAWVSPPNDTNFVGEIVFRWELAEGQQYTGPFELRLLNNKEEEMYRFKVGQQPFHFNRKLVPGLYYWALLTENEMAYLGRFYVRRAER